MLTVIKCIKHNDNGVSENVEQKEQFQHSTSGIRRRISTYKNCGYN